MPLVILTAVLPDGARVPWGVNPCHVTEVHGTTDPDRCTVAILRGARTEAHTVLGSGPAVVAMLNHDPAALAALEQLEHHQHDDDGAALADAAEPCRWCGAPLDEHEAHQADDGRAPSHTYIGPDEDRAALDTIARHLRFPEWPGASAIEDIAEMVRAVRNLDNGPAVDEWRRH